MVKIIIGTLFFAQTKQILKYYSLISKSNSIGMIANFNRLEPLSFFSKRYRFGFDVHSKFLHEQELYKLMFAFEWQSKDKRKYKINFLGNKQPNIRNDILNTIKRYFNLSDNLIGQIQHIPQLDYSLIWLEYDGKTPMNKRGVRPKEYINLLSECDFTLCPPGYISLTHRVIEALVRGKHSYY